MDNNDLSRLMTKVCMLLGGMLPDNLAFSITIMDTDDTNAFTAGNLDAEGQQSMLGIAIKELEKKKDMKPIQISVDSVGNEFRQH